MLDKSFDRLFHRFVNSNAFYAVTPEAVTLAAAKTPFTVLRAFSYDLHPKVRQVRETDGLS